MNKNIYLGKYISIWLLTDFGLALTFSYDDCGPSMEFTFLFITFNIWLYPIEKRTKLCYPDMLKAHLVLSDELERKGMTKERYKTNSFK